MKRVMWGFIAAGYTAQGYFLLGPFGHEQEVKRLGQGCSPSEKDTETAPKIVPEHGSPKCSPG